jgi:hypothetical protein
MCVSFSHNLPLSTDDSAVHIGQSPSKLPGPDEASVNIWAAELALGINFLHGHGIIHR